jgi:hypothetical protein
MLAVFYEYTASVKTKWSKPTVALILRALA